MELSDEEENFTKIAKLVLDVFPNYLRKCFIEQWNNKFPSQKWQSDNKQLKKSIKLEKMLKY